ILCPYCCTSTGGLPAIRITPHTPKFRQLYKFSKVLSLQRLHLAEAPHVAFFLAWLRGQKSIGEFFRQRGTDDPCPDAQDIHPIMFDTLMGAVGIVADRCVNALKLIGGDTCANPTAAQEQPALDTSLKHCLRNRCRNVRV